MLAARTLLPFYFWLRVLATMGIHPTVVVLVLLRSWLHRCCPLNPFTPPDSFNQTPKGFRGQAASSVSYNGSPPFPSHVPTS